MSPEQIHSMVHIMWICVGVNFVGAMIHWFRNNSTMVFFLGSLMMCCLAVAIGLLKYGG